MKLIKTIAILIVSIILQTILLPFRMIGLVFNSIESIGRILKNTTNHLIKQVEKEVLVIK